MVSLALFRVQSSLFSGGLMRRRRRRRLCAALYIVKVTSLGISVSELRKSRVQQRETKGESRSGRV